MSAVQVICQDVKCLRNTEQHIYQLIYFYLYDFICRTLDRMSKNLESSSTGSQNCQNENKKRKGKKSNY